MSVLRLSSLLISYSSVGKSEQGLGGVSQTELLLLSRDPVLRAHQEPDLTIDLDCITCTYNKGGKPGGSCRGARVRAGVRSLEVQH